MINARPSPAKQHNEVHMILLSTTRPNPVYNVTGTPWYSTTHAQREKQKDFVFKKKDVRVIYECRDE